MPIQPYIPNNNTTVLRRKLPHWEQQGCTYFITFRLNDSIPRSKLEDWNQRRMNWLNRINVDPNTSSADLPDKLNAEQKIEYYQKFTQYYHDLLDSGLGSCLLRKTINATILADTLLFFDQDRYRMGDFIIMPNHVHLLVTPLEPWSISQLLQSWKRYSAREINKAAHQTGTLWRAESYDHIVRNEQQHIRIQQYIRENPKGLKPGEFFYYEAPQSRTGLQPVDNPSTQPKPD
jgi:hypothetical protein